MFSPKDADFQEILDSLPTKSSIVLVSFIFKRSNSAIRVCKRASLTLSAPRWHAVMASHTFFAVSSSLTCKISAYGMVWKRRAMAISFFSFSIVSLSTISHTLWTLRKIFTRLKLYSLLYSASDNLWMMVLLLVSQVRLWYLPSFSVLISDFALILIIVQTCMIAHKIIRIISLLAEENL